jgi:hypothetical protein
MMSWKEFRSGVRDLSLEELRKTKNLQSTAIRIEHLWNTRLHSYLCTNLLRPTCS